MSRSKVNWTPALDRITPLVSHWTVNDLRYIREVTVGLRKPAPTRGSSSSLWSSIQLRFFFLQGGHFEVERKLMLVRFDAQRRSWDNPLASPSILHAENEKLSSLLSLIWEVRQKKVKQSKIQPWALSGIPLYLYSPQRQHPAFTPAPSLQTVDRLSVGLRCTHCVNLSCTSDKVTVKFCASSANSPITAWLIYCYSASLPRTDLCLLHCLSLTWLTQIPENPTHMHTHSCFFAFIDFVFSNIFFHHSTGKLGYKKRQKRTKLCLQRETPNWKYGLLSNEIHPDDVCMNIFMRDMEEKQAK